MAEEQVVIQTKLGKLRGHTKQSHFTSKTFYAFQGIPFGKPPVGELRFKAPQPFGGWVGIRDALEDGNQPKQPVIVPMPGQDINKPQGDEDCLYLNVYTLQLPEQNSSLKPVMVSIHGGGFAGGSGGFEMMGPDYFMTGDVVLVSFNYRCGAFGFLSLENEEVPGNAGLKDQTLALQWVSDNIHSFGGDRNNVTIFGISAGGASVHYQLLSPLSKGLFHKAIAQSGFAFNPWTEQRNPRSVATKLAKALGCTSEIPEEVLAFLQTASGDDIVEATKALGKYKEFEDKATFIFTPSVEVSGHQPFLPDTPDNLMKNGKFNKVPVILGVTGNEASLISLVERPTTEELENINKHPEQLVPYFLGLKPGSEDEKEVGNALKELYFKGKPLTMDDLMGYLQWQSDFQFNIGMEKTRSYLVEKSFSPVYSYLFSNHTRCICNFLQATLPKDKFNMIAVTKESCHGADAQFIYVVRMFSTPELTPEDKIAIGKHIKAWTMFAAVGDPNCKELGALWERDSESNPRFMDIGTSWDLREGIPFEERMNLWRKLISKYCR